MEDERIHQAASMENEHHRSASMEKGCNYQAPDNGLANQAYSTMRTTWTPSMDSFFINLMLDQARRRQRTEKTFSKVAWSQMTISFNKKYGLRVDKEVLKNRFKKLRMKFVDMKNLLNTSGFGWDDSRQMIIGEDKVWDDYLKAHPDKKNMRTSTMPNYYHLHEIFSSCSTNRQLCHSGDDVISKTHVGDRKMIETNFNIAEKGTVGDYESCSEEDIPSKKVKCSTEISISSQGQGAKRRTGGGLVDALSTMAATVSSLVDLQKEVIRGTGGPIREAFEALNAIPNLEDDFYLDACDLLEDEKKAKVFTAIDASRRKAWLIKKLGSNG